jgi:hypothetical protein
LFPILAEKEISQDLASRSLRYTIQMLDLRLLDALGCNPGADIIDFFVPLRDLFTPWRFQLYGFQFARDGIEVFKGGGESGDYVVVLGFGVGL